MRHSVIWAILLLVTPVTGAIGAELELPSFKVNGEVHSNVLVSSSSKGRVIVRHATGLATVRIADLDYDMLQKLADAEIISGPAVKDLLAKKAPKKQRDQQSLTNQSAMVLLDSDVPMNAKAALLVQAGRARLENEARALGIQPPDLEKSLSTIRWEVGLGILGGILLLYILRCWCLFRVCQRATGRGSILVFAPLLRWFPLADAAKMSRQWLAIPVFALFGLYLPPALPQLPWVPLAYLSLISVLWLITVILFIVWCLRVAKELKHSAFVGFLLMLPILDWFALLYVAMSGDKSDGRISLNPRRAAI